MRLLLISNTPIIIKIFTLICQKLELSLNIQKDNNVDEKYDIIIIDNEFVDDKFNIIKQFTKKIGAIVAEELPFDKSRDFLVPRPFLPNELQEILKEQIALIHEEAEQEKKESIRLTSAQETDEATSYLNSLADDIAHDIEDESDESIVTLASLKDGGVLDMGELGKIKNLLDVEPPTEHEIEMDEDDWHDLSDIIDKALDEVKDYEFDISDDNSKYITLVLNRFTMDELKPLLLKLDQNSIDTLTSGDTINLKLKLKETN